MVALALAAYWVHTTSSSAAGFSLLVGAALGIVFERGRFCFFCIFRDAIEDKDTSGTYSVLAALAVGGAGYAVVFALFLPDAGAGRLPPEAHIGPVHWALVLAGLAFGVGMALSGACISGHLYRLGQGYTRAVPALIGAVVGFGFGFATWNTIYLAAVSGSPTPWLPAWLGYGGSTILHLAVLGVVALVLLRWLPARAARAGGAVRLRGIRDAVIRRRWGAGTTGAAVGIIGIFAYLRVEPLGVTAQLGSLTRTTMAGTDLLPERLDGLDTLAGCATAVVQAVTDNGWLVIGLVIASFAAALSGNRFKLSRLSLRGGGTALAGGVLMGWRAMTALGCTVGVLLSGISAFALSGWVFGLAVLAGVWLGVRLKLHALD